jgi:anti-sigma regulatory factor (Ser/Thr protein kinase)
MLRARTTWVNQGEFGPFDLTTRATVGFTSRTGRTRIATQIGIAAKAATARVNSRTRSVGDGIDLRLRGGPEAGARARRALSRLRADIDPPLMEILRLLVTELVSNSVRHAHSETVALKVVVGRSAVLTEVTDEGPGFDPAQTGPSGSRDSGWGLFLVERLAHRWGVAQDGHATRVWFELLRV